VSRTDNASSGDVRGIVLQAAFDELVVTGIDRFSFDRVCVQNAANCATASTR